MNKRDLVDAIVDELGDDIAKTDVEDTVDAFAYVVSKSLRDGESVTLARFGTFEARKRQGRTGVNPQTGESIRIKATTVPAFKAGQPLKDYVAKKPGAADKLTRPARKASAKKATKKASAKKAGAKKATKKASAKKAGAKKATKKASAKKAAKKAARKVARRR